MYGFKCLFTHFSAVSLLERLYRYKKFFGRLNSCPKEDDVAKLMEECSDWLPE